MASWVLPITMSLSYAGFGVYINSLCKQYPDKVASFDKIGIAALHGALPGFEWGCNIMFILYFTPSGGGVGIILGCLIHAISAFLIMGAALGSQETSDGIQGFLEGKLGVVKSTFTGELREQIDTKFAFEDHCLPVVIVRSMVTSELTLLPFLPWKVGHEYITSQGYPTAELLQLTVVLKCTQCGISFLSLVVVCAMYSEVDTSYWGAKLALIIVYMIAMVFSVLLLLKKVYDLHYAFDSHANKLEAETPDAIKDMMASMEEGGDASPSRQEPEKKEKDSRFSEFEVDMGSIYSGGGGKSSSAPSTDNFDSFGFSSSDTGDFSRGSTFQSSNPLFGQQLPQSDTPPAQPSGKIEIKKVRRTSHLAPADGRPPVKAPQPKSQPSLQENNEFDDNSDDESTDDEGGKPKSFAKKALDHIDKHIDKIGNTIDKVSEGISNTYGHSRSSSDKEALAANAEARPSEFAEAAESYGTKHSGIAVEATHDDDLHEGLRKAKEEEDAGDGEFRL